MENLHWDRDRAEHFVSALYRLFLERFPDEKGLQHKVQLLLTGTNNPEDTVAGFLESNEFTGRHFAKVWATAHCPYLLDLHANEEELEALWNKTATYWRRAGADPNAIYFSVLAADAMKRDLDGEQLRGFYDGGKKFVDFMMEKVASHLDGHLKKKALDFGAGVGRLSVHASQHFERVVATDFSAKHLDTLQENLDRLPHLNCRNIETAFLNHPRDFGEIEEGFDLVFSYITLQHNTPPVMAAVVAQLLQCLRIGGVGFLHIPIHHPFYKFSSVSDYLASPVAGTTMEMHILPRENIRKIADEAGCQLIDSFGYGGTQRVYSEIFQIQRVR